MGKHEMDRLGIYFKHLIWVFPLVWFLTGCMKEFAPLSEGSTGISGTEEILPFAKGRFVPNCLEVEVNGANACIFGKNPVADTGQSLSNPPVINAGSILNERETRLYGISDVSELQTYAVNIPGNKLANEDFVSITFDGADTLPRNADGDWRYLFHNDSNLSTVKTHTFFWINHLAQSIKNTTGIFYAEGQLISVLPVLAVLESSDGERKLVINAFWSESFNLLTFGISVSLGFDSQGESIHMPIGLDSGIVAHEMGHGILDYASPAKIKFNPQLERNDCGPSSSATCSKTLSGSPAAIHEGVGDTMALFLFPNSTPTGETFNNDPSGLDHCGIPRDVQKIKTQGLEARDLFDACSRASASGEIHALGSIYSTIWYGVFQKALERGGETERESAYQLFFEHLKNVTTNDTFETMRETIKSIDANLFSGRFSEDLDAEYESLGY